MSRFDPRWRIKMLELTSDHRNAVGHEELNDVWEQISQHLGLPADNNEEQTKC